MKILFVTPYFYPKIGGLENYVYNVAKRLAKKEEVIIITTNHDKKKYKEEEINNMKIYRLPYLIKLSHTPLNPFWYFKIKKIIALEKPDVINAHLPVPFIADLVCFINPKKTIITYHNDLVKPSFVLGKICKLYYSLIGNYTLKSCKSIIATSDYYVETSEYLRPLKKKINIVSPGVDIKIFNPKIKKGFLNSKQKKLFFIAQLDKTHEHKGLKYLLFALKLVKQKYPKVKLFIGGKGDQLEFYKKLVKRLKLEENIIFLDFISNKNLPLAYKDADITILPTYNGSEGFGMVLAEANACGTPVIGSKVGGIPVVIENNYNGVLVPPKDVKALAMAIIRLLGNKKLARKLGKNGAKKAKEKWDWDVLTKKTLEVFKE